mmetsp:Transcript_13758/g.26867  ORF Transcript_13758/g.26867 Transcript_13758/m.26867 type:complete len:833 (+) Transcript_13758:196-2694(+)
MASRPPAAHAKRVHSVNNGCNFGHVGTSAASPHVPFERVPLTVKQALVPASTLLSALDKGRLSHIDMRPLIIHVLRGLQRVGIERTVVALGQGANAIVESVRRHPFNMQVDFVWGNEFAWGSALANSIMAARSAFQDNEPLLIVRSDYLFDWRLLQKMATVRFTRDIDVFALVDTGPETLEWVSGAHCNAHCKDGHCHTLVKVLRGEGDRVATIGHRLSSYDALVAGIFACRPLIFAQLERHLNEQLYCTVADSMQEIAAVGRLRFVETGALGCNTSWFGHETLQVALTQSLSPSTNEAVQPAWTRAALELLGFDCAVGESAAPAYPKDADAIDGPLYELGEAIGKGSFGEVVEACSQSVQSAASAAYRTDRDGTPHRRPSLPPPDARGGARTHQASTEGAHSWSAEVASSAFSRSNLDQHVQHQLQEQMHAHQSHTQMQQLESSQQLQQLKSSQEAQRSTSPRSMQPHALSHSRRTRWRPSEKPFCGTPPSSPVSSPLSTSLSTSLQQSTQDKGQSGKQQLAVKVVRKGSLDGKVDRIMWEVHVMRHLAGHPHIAKLVDVIDLTDAVYIVMERVDGPCLLSFIRRQPQGRLEPEVARRFFCQMLSALKFTHANGYIHGDVKPENVRLTSTCDSAVLVDWGFAQRIGPQPHRVMQGTPAYAAPELLMGYRGDGVTDKSHWLCATVDVWALGASLVEMLCGEPPFRGDCFESLVRNVRDLRYELPSYVPLELRLLIDSMLQLHPTDRASVAELCAHPWVSTSGMLPADHEVVLECLECGETPKRKEGACRWKASYRLVLLVAYAVLCSAALAWHLRSSAPVAFEHAAQHAVTR